MYNNKFVVAIKVNNKILRETNNSVTLPFNSEYTILLKNLNTTLAVCSVEIDGADIADGNTFVVYPDQSLEIKRFVKNNNLNAGNAFKFIEKTKDIEEYRGNKIEDGLVKVTYQFQSDYYQKLKTIDDNWNDDIYNIRKRKKWPNNHYNYYDYYNDCNVILTSQAYYQCHAEPQLQSGITVRGSEIKQKFTNVSVSGLEQTKHTIVFKLYGKHNERVAIKPITVNDKKVCDICGTSNKYNNNFCFKCGNNLNII